MRTPFLKEPIKAPWWAFLYTLHHFLWCELHYGHSWYRTRYRQTQYDTRGMGIIAYWLVLILCAVVLYCVLAAVNWLLVYQH